VCEPQCFEEERKVVKINKVDTNGTVPESTIESTDRAASVLFKTRRLDIDKINQIGTLVVTKHIVSARAKD
jgi:hypothetical protein